MEEGASYGEIMKERILRLLHDNLCTWILLFAVLFFVLCLVVDALPCISDYECSPGLSCVKEYYSYSGTCITFEDRNGKAHRYRPNPESIRLNTERPRENVRCPTGYMWSYKLQLCVR